MDDRFLSRGKAKDSGEWVVGYYCPTAFMYFPCKPSIYPADTINRHWHAVEIIPETLGGCTGATDKNGKSIFDGDIIQAGGLKFIVKFGNCGGVKNVDHEVGYIGFYVMPIGVDDVANNITRTDIMYWLNAYDALVIGNIHDNPELLQESQEGK